MRSRLGGEPVTGKAWMKTGSLNDVRTIAGYLDAASGRRYAVVLQERIAMAGWRCLGVAVTERKTVPGNPWMNHEELHDMVSYDVQA